ncbi:armadillo-type protein [Gautieria morchelliformis]|nr:armadillo-type protein [Gautieria morchelliformis]
MSSRSSTPIITSNTLASLQSILLNAKGTVPLAHRFRALFTLKSFGKSTAVVEDNGPVSDAAIRIIALGFDDPSALLKHELAYVLGQMGNLHAVPVLEQVLGDMRQDAMVRHEASLILTLYIKFYLIAAEALGALSSTTSEPVLRRYLNDEERCVRETCEIALARIEWAGSQNADVHKRPETEENLSQFTSVDPAPPSSLPPTSAPHTSQIDSLRSALTSRTLPLFERYRAMFALRNIAGSRHLDTEKYAVDALAAGFSDDSELFKHEIAFVFGQLSTAHSIPALLRVLRDPRESSMVRHEAAEALGGISEPVDVLAVLKEWSQREDAPRVVRESCIVAVDMWEYENSNEFQYANGLDSAESIERSPEDLKDVTENIERKNVPAGAPIAVGA